MVTNVGKWGAALRLLLLFLGTSRWHAGYCHAEDTYVSAAKARPLLVDVAMVGVEGETAELPDSSKANTGAAAMSAGIEPNVDEPQTAGRAGEGLGKGCSSSDSSGCRVSVLRLLRVDVLVTSLRLQRWAFGAASASDASVERTVPDDDVGVSVHVSEAAASDPWSSMSSDEVDLFFPNAEEYEEGGQGETVILQLQA